MDHPRSGRIRSVASPLRPLAPAPWLGQHATEVLRELLDCGDAELAALQS